MRSVFYGPVAQLVEHVTFNHRVLGSSPSRLTCSSFLLSKNDLKRKICVEWQTINHQYTSIALIQRQAERVEKQDEIILPGSVI